MSDNYKNSAINRTRYGEMLDHVLPCRRDDCAMLDTCSLVKPIDRRPAYSEPCPVEQQYIQDMKRSFRKHQAPMLNLREDEIDDTAEAYALFHLRRARLSERLKNAWEMISGDDKRRELGLVNRYMGAIDREANTIFTRILSRSV